MHKLKKTGETSSFCFILCPISHNTTVESLGLRATNLSIPTACHLICILKSKKSSHFFCTLKIKHYLCVAIEGKPDIDI